MVWPREESDFKSGRPTIDEKDVDPQRRRARALQSGLALWAKAKHQGASCYTKQIKDLSYITNALVCVQGEAYLGGYIFFINLSSTKNVKRFFKASDLPSSLVCEWKLMFLIWLCAVSSDAVFGII